MTCRCGHRRDQHRATYNAIAKKRRLGDRRPARASCQALLVLPPRMVVATDTVTITYSGIQTTCPCRDWHPSDKER